ncbi:MAG: MBL fold metallo-hydrolase [Burkholderiales bacterium]|nr:MBL fold metallo-hydrolase [Burkholderiales bacterium]
MSGTYSLPPGSAAAGGGAAGALRHAATVLLLRDGAAGLEVLMMRRAERPGDFRSGACVFPGGVVDARDRAAHACCRGSDDATMSRRLGLAAGGLDYAVAALREAFEEVGLLLADRAVDPAAARPWRQALQAGTAGIAEMCDALGFGLDLGGLEYCAHWLTPLGVPKRFDTRFFMARAPAGQEAEADGGEASELMWITPAAALAAAAELKLLPVTRRNLQELGRFADADAALADARGRSEIRRVFPRAGRSRQGREVVLPDGWAYAEIGRLDPEGRGHVSTEIVAGVAVALSERVIRVTAPNPGRMTGPGTNSYLVGGGGRWTVIDPGPADATHLQALLAAAAPGRIERILVTHSHVDHSPGAQALAEATGAPVFGRYAEFPDGQDASLALERELRAGERLDCGPDTTLEVIHTPGHASNHLCYRLVQEKLLFSGDHVMQGSTVVINPPDGDMAAYLNALRELQGADLEWLAPGHGFLVADPSAVLRGLIAHRLAREARVLAALKRQGRAGLDALLPEVYAEVPTVLHPVARRSLLAHLIKLEADGCAESDGADWIYALD